MEMKPTEMRELSDDELIQKEEELKDQLFKLKFQHAMGQLENAMKLKNLKRDRARILTILKERKEEEGKE
jgi:large subunit ribosomal protein L29